MSFKKKLKLLATVSIVAILTLLSFNIINGYSYNSKLKQVEKFVKLNKQISSLVHQLQKERSINALFLQSKGNYAAELIFKQRELTDKEIVNFKKVAQSIQIKQFDLNLAKVRMQITQFKVSFNTATDIYTKTISNLINLTTLNSHIAPAGVVSQELRAYSIFLKSKEQLSLKRAYLSSVFLSRHNLTNTLKNKIKILSIKEDIYLDVFLNNISTQIAKFYTQKTDIDLFKDAKKTINLMTGNNSTQNNELEIKKWFMVVSKKIQTLHTIEKQILEKVEREINPTNTLVLLSIVVGLIFAILILYLGYLINQELKRRIHAMDWIVEP